MGVESEGQRVRGCGRAGSEAWGQLMGVGSGGQWVRGWVRGVC